MAVGTRSRKVRPVQDDASREGDNTKREFLDAAEMLFAKHGFDGTKVRAIAEQSGANLGILHYYWGSKEALFREVCERRLRPITEERIARFDRVVAAAGGGKPDLRMVIEAAILPAAEHAAASVKKDAPDHIAELMGRMLNDPSPVPTEITRQIFDEASFRYVRLLRQACDHLDDPSFYGRLHIVLGAAQHFLSGRERITHLSGGRQNGRDLLAGASSLIDGLVAAMEAPVSAPG